MDFSDLTDIIDFAISQEQEAADFYRRISEKEAQIDKKDLFLQFADEEEKHLKLLDSLKSGSTAIALEDYRFTWITDIKRSNYVADLVYTPGMPYRDILMLAAKREEKSLELYNLLFEKAKNEVAGRVFKMLCQEEARHKLVLESTLDAYMAEMGD